MSMLSSKKYTKLTLVLKWFLVTRTGTQSMNVRTGHLPR